jgi:hypothetical protein
MGWAIYYVKRKYMTRKPVKQQVVRKVKYDSERMARRQLLEEMFYDFNRNRWQVYMMNFGRGIFFGLGTVLGGTVLVAFIVWILGQFAGWFPDVGDYIHQIIKAMQHSK